MGYRFDRAEWFVVENTYKKAIHRWGVAYASGTTPDSGRPCWYVLFPHKTKGKDYALSLWTHENTRRHDEIPVARIIGDFEFPEEIRRRALADRVYVRHKITGAVGSHIRGSGKRDTRGRVFVVGLDGKSCGVQRHLLEEIGEAEYQRAAADYCPPPPPKESASWRRCEICGNPINPDPLIDGGWRRHMACHRAVIESIKRREQAIQGYAA